MQSSLQHPQPFRVNQLNQLKSTFQNFPATTKHVRFAPADEVFNLPPTTTPSTAQFPHCPLLPPTTTCTLQSTPPMPSIGSTIPIPAHTKVAFSHSSIQVTLPLLLPHIISPISTPPLSKSGATP